MNCLLSSSSGPSCSREQASSKGSVFGSERGGGIRTALSPSYADAVSQRRCRSPPHGAPRPLSLCPSAGVLSGAALCPRAPFPPGPRPWRGMQPTDLPRAGCERRTDHSLLQKWIRAGGGEPELGRSRASPTRETWLRRVVSQGSCGFRHSDAPSARACAPPRGQPRLDPRPHSRAWGTLKGQWGAVMADPTGAQVQGGTLTSGVWEHKGGRAPEPPGWLSGWASRYAPHTGAQGTHAGARGPHAASPCTGAGGRLGRRKA